MARKKIMFQKLQELISRYEFKIEDMKVTVAKAADVTVAKSFEFLPKHLYVMDQAYCEHLKLFVLRDEKSGKTMVEMKLRIMLLLFRI